MIACVGTSSTFYTFSKPLVLLSPHAWHFSLNWGLLNYFWGYIVYCTCVLTYLPLETKATFFKTLSLNGCVNLPCNLACWGKPNLEINESEYDYEWRPVQIMLLMDRFVVRTSLLLETQNPCNHKTLTQGLSFREGWLMKWWKQNYVSCHTRSGQVMAIFMIGHEWLCYRTHGLRVPVHMFKFRSLSFRFQHSWPQETTYSVKIQCYINIQSIIAITHCVYK